MPWKCPQDGNDVQDGMDQCPLCGFVRFPLGVVLRSDATGKEIAVRVGATFGSANLGILNDADVKYVSPEQFRIEKRTDQGGWAVTNVSWAMNPMFLNGSPVGPSGVVLKDGDRLSVKDKFFRLTVRVLMN